MAHQATIETHVLSREQTSALYQARGRWLLRKACPIVPIQLKITNERDHEVIFDPKTITLNLLSWQEVACRLRLATCGRVISTTGLCVMITAGSFLGAAYITIIGATLSIPLLIKAGYGALAFSGLMISSTPFMGYHQAKKCSSFNKSLQRELQSSIPTAPLTISAGATYCGMLFVHKHRLPSQFSFILQDLTIDHPLEFEVNL